MKAPRQPYIVVGLIAFLAILFVSIARGQFSSILDSEHNLSTLGRGKIRASSEEQVCIFCHTPHNAAPIQPLWNRSVPVENYTVYSSNSMQALPGQPTGSSKLCLSCHDGTIALGSVTSRGQPIAMAGGMTTLPPGSSNLGTDLSDDHPISFRYDQSLAARDGKLASPAALPAPLHLDSRGELQCTTCHDAHNDANGKFLVMNNSDSRLCRSCHLEPGTNIAGHDECASCHQSHSAPSGPYLLRGKTVSLTCVSCHDSSSDPKKGANIQSELSKPSKHDTNVRVNLVNNAPDNIGCADCHESHTMQSDTATAPDISPRLGHIDGVNAAGAPVARAQFEYEVCFKCHADRSATTPAVTRQSGQNNKRLQTASTALSYHPIQVAVRNSDVPSLRPGLSAGSLIYCSDCHGSDSSKKAGGSGANGPHGSAATPLLIAEYRTADGTAESATAYALCYSCHERNSILANQSFTRHASHIVDDRTPCSVCHDSHGVVPGDGVQMNGGRALINFDISVVQPDPVTHQLKFTSGGSGRGECYLSCHGVAHSPKSY